MRQPQPTWVAAAGSFTTGWRPPEPLGLLVRVTDSYNSRHKMARLLWKTSVAGFDTGAVSVETWIPDGGFEIQRRKVKGADGSPAVADCLVPKWPDAEVFSSRPCQEEPCLHRILAECQPGGVLSFAGDYGLMAFSMPRHLAGKKVRAGDVLQPEPLSFWQEEIGLLRRLTGLWDSILANERKARTKTDEAELRRRLRQADDAKPADLIRLGRQRLARELTAKLAGVRFDLTASAEGENDRFVIRCQTARLIDALWQRFAEEIAGLIACAKCPAPGCGRWFLRSTGRSDKAYCSGRCRMRKRRGVGGDAR